MMLASTNSSKVKASLFPCNNSEGVKQWQLEKMNDKKESQDRDYSC